MDTRYISNVLLASIKSKPSKVSQLEIHSKRKAGNSTLSTLQAIFRNHSNYIATTEKTPVGVGKSFILHSVIRLVNHLKLFFKNMDNKIRKMFL